MKHKIFKIIPAQTAPILVIVFALAMLIGGGYYVWAHGGGVLGAITPADPWDNDVNMGVTAGEPLTAQKWNSLVNRVQGMASFPGIPCADAGLSFKVGERRETVGVPILCSGCCGFDETCSRRCENSIFDLYIYYLECGATGFVSEISVDGPIRQGSGCHCNGQCTEIHHR